MERLFQRLRHARQEAGLSQSDVAQQLRMHRPTITQIETGRRKVTAEELGQLARLYNVPMSWLVHGQINGMDNRFDRVALALSRLSREQIDGLMTLLSTLRQTSE
jgi:transcriptional regulator with XRE-family HTH domain